MQCLIANRKKESYRDKRQGVEKHERPGASVAYQTASAPRKVVACVYRGLPGHLFSVSASCYISLHPINLTKTDVCESIIATSMLNDRSPLLLLCAGGRVPGHNTGESEWTASGPVTFGPEFEA